MAVWFILALMTGACVLAVLWPLSRRALAVDAVGAETTFYEDQLAEIGRDAGRGLIAPAEAEAARAEAGRRLLRACRAAPAAGSAEGEPALRRRRAAAAFALSTVPLVALVTYGIHGSPDLPARPAAARVAERTGQNFDIDGAVARIEAHLAKNPDDGRGWELLAPVYLRAGRLEDAARASGQALRLNGETPARLADHGEMMVAAADGVVTAEARATFERALGLDAALPKARFYLARATEQDGAPALAAERYAALAADAPADAPWLPAVRERLTALAAGRGTASPAASLLAKSPLDKSPVAKSPLDKSPPAASSPTLSSPAAVRAEPGPEAAIAALPDAERATAIRGMVERLDRRLAAQRRHGPRSGRGSCAPTSCSASPPGPRRARHGPRRARRRPAGADRGSTARARGLGWRRPR